MFKVIVRELAGYLAYIKHWVPQASTANYYYYCHLYGANSNWMRCIDCYMHCSQCHRECFQPSMKQKLGRTMVMINVALDHSLSMSKRLHSWTVSRWLLVPLGATLCVVCWFASLVSSVSVRL